MSIQTVKCLFPVSEELGSSPRISHNKRETNYTRNPGTEVLGETHGFLPLGRLGTQSELWKGRYLTSWDVKGTRMPIPPDKVV